MKILVINAGSSSIKYQLFDMATETVLTSGLVEKIGEETSRIRHVAFIKEQQREVIQELKVENHRQGLERVAQLLMDGHIGVISAPADIAAIGHRVVHGGEQFSRPTIIDAAVIAQLKTLSPFAPLHNPPNLVGIEVAGQIFPKATQVAIFDTAFHQTMPPAAYRYAIPNWLYEEHGVRAYGFHGTSHLYVSRQAAQHLGRPLAETNLITIHLGNGCSMTAVRGGRSIDTSMGFSPLAGLMMGTRSGDLDPAVFYFMGARLGWSFEDIDHLLNKQSGLLGISGHNDLREIQQRQAQGETAAQLALEMYTYRIKKYIGAYMAALGRVEALVFTAGVGENSAYVREQACQGLDNLGIVLDPEKNETGPTGPITEIQASGSRIKILIIRTNEELEIAHQTAAVLENYHQNP